MLVPMRWLKQYAPIETDAQTLTDHMAMTGTEIEGFEEQGKDIHRVVVGRVLGMQKHPNADKLWICSIDAGQEKPVQIVTGAQNVFEGALVPVALDGSRLPDGKQIKTGKLRGEQSEGMLCSGEELLLKEADYPGAEEHGIMILVKHPDALPGTDMREVLGLDDTILNFKILANRPDCMGILGLAREAAVTMGVPFNAPEPQFEENGAAIEEHIHIEVRDPDLCPRYVGRVITGVTIAPSPQWMQKLLTAAGIRPINNVVDITNYVMLETGQPLHAFDLRNIRDKQVIVRRAQPGEELVTLDGKQRILGPDMLVIADAQGAIGLAGIMGGENSEINEDTVDVLLESAKFDAAATRIAARALGIRTEASARNEKGLDIFLPQIAANRATALLQQLAGGKVCKGVIDLYNQLPQPKQLMIPAQRIRSYLGIDIPTMRMVEILNSLNIQTTLDGETLICTVPGFRNDIEGMADICEEVLRIYGYDRLPSPALRGQIQGGGRTRAQALRMQARQALSGLGYDEQITYSFISPNALAKLGIRGDHPLSRTARLLNPLGEEFSVMRTTLLPGMLDTLLTNLSHKNTDIRLFEMSKVYFPKELPMAEQPVEADALCLGCEGEAFYSVKGDLDALAAAAGIRKPLKYEAGGPDWLHPGRKANVLLDHTVIGYLGELHPDVAQRWGLDQRVTVAEIAWQPLLDASEEASFTALPKFPAVERDLALVVDHRQPAGPMIEAIRRACGALLEDVSIFDIYEGPQLGANKKSIAFSMKLRSDHTLKEEEISPVMARVVRSLGAQFGAEIRQ